MFQGGGKERQGIYGLQPILPIIAPVDSQRLFLWHLPDLVPALSSPWQTLASTCFHSCFMPVPPWPPLLQVHCPHFQSLPPSALPRFLPSWGLGQGGWETFLEKSFSLPHNAGSKGKVRGSCSSHVDIRSPRTTTAPPIVLKFSPVIPCL